MPQNAAPGATSPLTDLIEELSAELERAERDQRETSRMVQQSRGEVEKLTQRNATIATQLRQIQGNLENMPRADIKRAYETAQDAQQRMFNMRGQAEKLQGDQARLEQWVTQLRSIIEKLQALGPLAAGPVLTGSTNGEKPLIVRIVEAQETERQRLARQIHDGPAQSLSNFILQTEIAVRLFDIDTERAKAELSNLKLAAKTTFDGIRDFIFDLRPMMLDDLGLVPTVKRYVDAFREKSGLQVTLNITGVERRLESIREVMIFRGVQELLGNIRNHAQATQARVMLDIDDSRARAVVEDNGKGFDVETIFNGQKKTLGLTTLKERIESLGGQFDIESQEGQGARIVIDVPAPTVN